MKFDELHTIKILMCHLVTLTTSHNQMIDELMEDIATRIAVLIKEEECPNL